MTVTLPKAVQAFIDSRNAGNPHPAYRRWMEDVTQALNSAGSADDLQALIDHLSTDGTIEGIPDPSELDLVQGVGISVTNGNTIGLRPLGDSGVGTFKLLTRDGYGRASGTADGTAADVPYDNTTSGLAATNLQAAVDELAATGGGLADGDYGDITVGGSGTTLTIDAGAVTYAKMQDVSAAQRVIGRNTAGAGSAEEVTLSQLLDWVGSAANGDILYRAAGAWTRLAVGTNGHVLTLASGLPSWAASTGLTNFTEGVSTAAPNAIDPVVSLTATNAAINVDVAIIPKGAGGILAAVPNNAASGGNKRGSRAVDFQRSRTTAAQVASGNDSGIACGVDNTASLTNAFVGGGNGNTASGSSSATLGGTSGTASGLRSAIVGGSSNTASGAASVSHGTQANTKSIENARAHGVVTGKQALEVPLYAQTSNATPTTLRSNSGSAAATNQFALSSGSAAMVRVRVVARQSAGTGSGACAGWDTNVLIKNIGGTTSLVGTPSVAQTFGDAGASAWTIAITADDTNDALKIEVTGEASKTIQWTAHVVGVEA